MLLLVVSVLVAATAAARDSRCVQYKVDSEALTLSHKSDCTKFYICDSQGAALEMKCPPNTYFSAAEGVCSYDSSGCNGADIVHKPIQPIQPIEPIRPIQPIQPIQPNQPIKPETETGNGVKDQQDFLNAVCR